MEFGLLKSLEAACAVEFRTGIDDSWFDLALVKIPPKTRFASLNVGPRRGATWTCLLVPLFFFVFWPSVSFATQSSTSVPSRKQTALEYFDAAVQMRTSLESKPKRLRTAAEYQKVINRFRSVYYTYPASSRADDALLAVAELCQAMANDLKSPKYFEQAIKTYDFLEDQYPQSPYCAEALFASAEIYLNDLNDRKAAEEIFKEVLKNYPTFNKARNARARLDDLREQSRQTRVQPPKSLVTVSKSSSAEKAASVEVLGKDGAKIVTEPLQVTQANPTSPDKSSDPVAALAKNAEKLVRVNNVRFWETNQSARFVVDIDGAAQTADGTLTAPARIFLDIENAQLSTELMGKTFSLESGALRQLRCGQAREKVARIVVDLTDIKKYHLSRLRDPHRIVLDVESSQSADQAISAKTTSEMKPIRRGEPLGDELALVRAFDVAAVPERPPEVEAAAARKEASGEVHPRQERMQVSSERSQPDVEKRAQGKSNKPEGNNRSSSPLLVSREARPKSDGTLSLIRTLGLKIGRIVIDPGHGGYDKGTVGPSGLEEKELVLDIAFRLKKLIEERLNGEVILTRTDDTFVPLEERTYLANESQADLFISIHANSSQNRRVSGVETFFLNFASSPDVEEIAARENASSQKTIFELQDLVQKIALKEKVDESREFAQTIQKSMATQMQRTRTNAKDRGVKQAPFIVLIGANMPSILSEISFVSNPSDEKLLKSSNYRQKIAEALCRGIEEYSRNLSGLKTASNIVP